MPLTQCVRVPGRVDVAPPRRGGDRALRQCKAGGDQGGGARAQHGDISPCLHSPEAELTFFKPYYTPIGMKSIRNPEVGSVPDAGVRLSAIKVEWHANNNIGRAHV